MSKAGQVGFTKYGQRGVKWIGLESTEKTVRE